MRKNLYNVWKFLPAAIAVLLLAWGPPNCPDALVELTPRPTPPTASSPATAGLMLKITFPAGWQWTHTPWQTPLTVVEWQDTQGNWHEVEGWQGTPDHVIPGPSATMVGLKAWGVAAKDFGTGPFRWLVYNDHSLAERLAVSSPFNLPGGSGQDQIVNVLLERD